MTQFVCCYYQTEGGRLPVKEFIDSLDFKSQRKFFSVIGLLQEFGKRLPEPHAKYIGEDIYELRFFGQEGSIRVLYFFFDEHRIILTNGFIKKTNKILEHQKDLSINRRAMYLSKKGW